MKKTLSFLVIFAFLFSSVFTTGCFDSKNGIFSTRALGMFGLAMIIASTGGAGAGSTVAFAANTRGATTPTTLSLANNNVTVKVYDYSDNKKGEVLISGTPDLKGTEFKLDTTDTDEIKISGKKQLLIEVEATRDGNTEVIMSAIFYTNKKVDVHEVEINFESHAKRVAYDEWIGDKTDPDYVQFDSNVTAAATTATTDLAKDIETNLSNWLKGSELVKPSDKNIDAIVNAVSSDTYCRVYCDALPGTEKDGDFEFVDVRKYFEIFAFATDESSNENSNENSNKYGPFEIYSDSTFDFYLKAGHTYKFAVEPKSDEDLKTVFGEDVKKTKESKAIEIAAGTKERKLVATDFIDKVIE